MEIEGLVGDNIVAVADLVVGTVYCFGAACLWLASFPSRCVPWVLYLQEKDHLHNLVHGVSKDQQQLCVSFRNA